MSAPLQGVPNQPHLPGQNPQGKPDVMATLQSAVDILKGFGDEFAGGVKAQSQNKTVQKGSGGLYTPTDEPDVLPTGLEALAAATAGVEEEDKLQKKKKKQQQDALNTLMAKLSELEGAYNLDQLNEEEQEVVEEFFKNMGSIKQLKKELQFLINKEEKLQHIIDSNQSNTP